VEAANRNTETIDERLVARIQVMSEVLTRAASEAESIWSARGAAVANAIREKVDDLRDVIEGKGADLVTALGERGDDVSARFAGVGERAMHTLDQQMAGLATLLTRRTDELIAAVNGSAADPVRALSALTGQLRSEVADSSEALRNVAADVTQRSAETIEALLKRLTEQVEASSVSLSETVTRSAESSVGSLSGTGDRLRHELTSVIDNLGQTSAVIDQAIGSAGDRLAAVQSGLATRVEEFQHALGGISSQVTALGRLSATTQSDASALAGQLAQHAEALAVVGRDLAQQQQSVDTALERRRSSLQALIGDISGRSEAFEATLGRFAANVEDSFARSQARAQEISAALAAATRGASIAVAGQFETIRDTAAKERERTAQTLQATLEQTNAQLTAALDHAADRFRQSVAEVKDMAGQVQRELDQTRQELRRGVLDLPQETSETADAMRRVVSDQIRALKELAALVSDSGATYDVVEPSATTAVAGARFEKPLLRAAERTRELEGPSQSEVLAPVAEAVGGPATENPTLGRIGASELIPPFARAQTQPWPPSSAAPRPVAPTTSAPASTADRGQPGWLSNLLAAASRDEPEETASKGAETLEALSREISGLIDNAAAVEMWDRWRRGDTGAVSRRLYTEAGQQAFDELRRRFRADPQFRETTTRYMQEFERLLSKIGQNDRDGAQWRAYLLSNTGKVYTILAHASGKLG
jgi:DNA anti-recombination protein RmuC